MNKMKKVILAVFTITQLSTYQTYSAKPIDIKVNTTEQSTAVVKAETNPENNKSVLDADKIAITAKMAAIMACKQAEQKALSEKEELTAQDTKEASKEAENKTEDQKTKDQIDDLLTILEKIQAEVLQKWNMLIKPEAHPEMHWYVFCDDASCLIKEKGAVLPAPILNNLLEIVKIKRNSNDNFAAKLKNGDLLISETLIMIINNILTEINTNTQKALEYGVTQQDLNKIKLELKNYRTVIKNDLIKGKHRSLKQAFKEVKDIRKKLKPIFLKNPIYQQKFKNKLELEDTDSEESDKELNIFETMSLLNILDARIAQSRKAQSKAN